MNSRFGLLEIRNEEIFGAPTPGVGGADFARAQEEIAAANVTPLGRAETRVYDEILNNASDKERLWKVVEGDLGAVPAVAEGIGSVVALGGDGEKMAHMARRAAFAKVHRTERKRTETILPPVGEPAGAVRNRTPFVGLRLLIDPKTPTALETAPLRREYAIHTSKRRIRGGETTVGDTPTVAFQMPTITVETAAPATSEAAEPTRQPKSLRAKLAAGVLALANLIPTPPPRRTTRTFGGRHRRVPQEPSFAF